MKFRPALLLFVCCSLALQAQMQMNVEQLADMVRSSIALQHEDKKIADYVKKVKLTEKLTDKNIQDLLAQGAGPKTVAALKQLRDQTASMKPPEKDATYSPATVPDAPVSTGPPKVSVGPKKTFPPPDSVKQSEILDQMRQYASTYTGNLPNFICTQVTRRYVDPNWTPNGGDHYRIIDTVNHQLSYSNGHENYKIVMVNNRPIVGNLDEKQMNGGSRSSGEFGSMMRELFEKHSNATFNWDHWGNLDSKLMAVYNYFIDSGHSTYSIDYNGEQRIITAYKGLVYADADTGVVYRITFDAVDIPSGFPVQQAHEILDYGLQDISGREYICPLKATVYLRSGRQKTRNDIEFRLYRKFGTESEIKYDMESLAPLPDKEEKPLTSPPANDSDVPLPPNSAPPPPPHQ
jgi:hypothetical protein